jgi:hypothetical protein
LAYLFAFLQRMQQITTNTIRSKHADVTLQNAICRGSFGSHQYYKHKENMLGKLEP